MSVVDRACDPTGMIPALAAAPKPRRTYDHRLRQQVCRTGVRFFGHRIHIPRSTITSWKRRGVPPVITLAPFNQEQQDLVARVDKLEQRVRILGAVVRLLLALLRAAGFRLDRLP